MLRCRCCSFNFSDDDVHLFASVIEFAYDAILDFLLFALNRGNPGNEIHINARNSVTVPVTRHSLETSQQVSKRAVQAARAALLTALDEADQIRQPAPGSDRPSRILALCLLAASESTRTKTPMAKRRDLRPTGDRTVNMRKFTSTGITHPG
jgi:hypothetical protein